MIDFKVFSDFFFEMIRHLPTDICSLVKFIVNPVFNDLVDHPTTNMLREQLIVIAISSQSTSLVTFVVLVLFARDQVTIDKQLIDIIICILILAALIMLELCGQLLVREDAES